MVKFCRGQKPWQQLVAVRKQRTETEKIRELKKMPYSEISKGRESSHTLSTKKERKKRIIPDKQLKKHSD